MTTKIDQISHALGRMESSIDDLKQDSQTAAAASIDNMKEIAELKAGVEAVKEQIKQSTGRITILEPQVEDYKRLKWIVIGGLGVVTVIAGLIAAAINITIRWWFGV